MIRLTTFAAMLAAIILSACSTPKQPCLMPGVSESGGAAVAGARGGTAQRGESKPETGRHYGVTNPSSVYGRGDVESTSTYSPEARQAGAISNPKQWTGSADASAFAASSPASVRSTAGVLEMLSAQALATKPGSPEWKEVMDRIKVFVDFQAQKGERYMEQVIKLAPRFERCVMVNLDLAGSSTGGQDAVDPQNSAKAATGVPAAIEKAGKIVDGDLESSSGSAASSPEAKPAAASGELPDAPAGSAGEGAGS